MTNAAEDAKVALEYVYDYGLIDPLMMATRKLITEFETLHTWDGLMSLLDEHWPEDIFPTLDDREDRDTGPRIISLLRWVNKLRADYERAVQDWADNDANVLADSQRLAEENEKLRGTIETIRQFATESELARVRRTLSTDFYGRPIMPFLIPGADILAIIDRAATT